MYPRKLQPLIEELLAEFRVLYLTGPRQAGKTTLARSIAERLDMGYITLDDQATLASAESDPHGFIRSLGSKRVVLDEFQYAPSLIPAIKEASDKLKPGEKGKFLLTGSADIFRSARTQEALPGHMARLELFPLSLSEITGQSLNIIDFLLTGNFQSEPVLFTSREEMAGRVLLGGYPEAQSKSPRAKQAWFKSYMEGRLYKDFETLYAARGDYHSKLQAMVPYLAGLSGNLLKYSNIANDLELNDKLVKSYIEILDLMFIVRRVPAYLKNRAKRLAVRMPKIHYVDTGLACHLLGLRNAEQLLQSQYYGGLLESLVYMECCKQASWAQEDVAIYHFRDNNQHEVDIVLERSNAKIIGIEIKASASVKSQDFKGLVKLAEFSGKAFEQGILFYTGQEILPFKQGDFTFYALPIGLFLGGSINGNGRVNLA
jgi:predicted AAA+ superfamily ATPase